MKNSRNDLVERRGDVLTGFVFAHDVVDAGGFIWTMETIIGDLFAEKYVFLESLPVAKVGKWERNEDGLYVQCRLLHNNFHKAMPNCKTLIYEATNRKMLGITYSGVPEAVQLDPEKPPKTLRRFPIVNLALYYRRHITDEDTTAITAKLRPSGEAG